jgi:CHAD domain-containing protein
LNLDGIINDIDIELLHDLRVAVRCSRMVLGQLKGVFVPAAIEPFRRELKWLGTVTGSCRDLDVYLNEIDSYRALLPDKLAGALAPLEQHLRGARVDAHKQVVLHLSSPRFCRFLAEWQDYLTGPGDGGQATPAGNRPVSEIADERIRRAYQRFVSKGSKLGDEPQPALLHRLRIDAKKLRYLLELFHSLYDSQQVEHLVRKLKRIQDTLGDYNDLEVQRQSLAEHSQELTAQGQALPLTCQAIARLQTILGQRQEELRHASSGRFAELADATVRRQLDELLGNHSEEVP